MTSQEPPPSPIRVDVVSDVICPWCYIGKRHLEAALSQRPDLDVAVHWRAFQLNPDMPREGMARSDYLMAKFGRPDGGDLYDRVREFGRQAGIAFAFEAIRRTPNTVAAHRLIALAGGEGLQDAVVQALFDAYFRLGRDIGDMAALAEIGAAAGLAEDKLRSLGDTDAFEAEVLAEDAFARQNGVSGVPCFIVDRLFAVSGAQPASALIAAFDHALAQRKAPADAA